MINAIRRLFGPRRPHIPSPKWQESQDGSGARYTEILVADEPDSKVFAYLAAALMQDLRGEFTEKLTGLDEAYWDLQVGDDTIVLHLQHYLGIMIHPAGLSKATVGEKCLLDRAFGVIAKESVT